ncbi:MAG: hypothetical protein IJF21_02855 [Clostridia bacterium]|nr:hypothetical protein [Clostridia bacterium]MBQ3228894.1 hypothetical protein [Clostridia bacterium]
MKKDIMTERAARAFRDYARMGLVGSRSAIDTVCKIRGICSDSTALDMLAVFDTLRLLELLGDVIAIRSVRDIYFANAGSKPHSNEITLRIRRLADELHCDDRTVYRRLKKARDMWEYLRAREKKQTAGKRSLLTKLIT